MSDNDTDQPMKLVSIQQFCTHYSPGQTPAGLRAVIENNDPNHPVARNCYRQGKRRLIDVIGYMHDLRIQKQEASS